ncbi:DUF3613 domain-containing protein [Methylobacillus arboreus]|uniref:DUF3613 domain-containing protein n=1 Tax=Methylobacillus arboreus TaxID=755170 RepID=UPI001E32A8EF|nr:DUF3613 domain-containing protein [Methylobacillus arboreus]MCB5189661.1 DUF3613 domain-containing protein [Methylobacillus arboreus]
MIRKLNVTGLLCLSIFANCGWAADEQSEPERSEALSQTEQWLTLQREGSQASLNKQNLSGPAMDNIHKRYLDSFTRPIPERFDPGQFNRQ